MGTANRKPSYDKFVGTAVPTKELFYDYENLIFLNQFPIQTDEAVKLGLS